MSVRSTVLHAIDAVDAAGRRHRLALRRFHDPHRLGRDPWYSPENEARVLRLLEGSSVAAPRLLADDVGRRVFDDPALLMTRLTGRPPGRVPDLEAFLRELAAALATIHAVQAPAKARLLRYAPYGGSLDRRPPGWSRHRRVWERAFEILAGPPPPTRLGFIHRDFHQGQTLWSRGRLTGVVDWTTGCLGPSAIDLARVRLNLAADFGVDAAARFLKVHRSEAGEDSHHPYWDLLDAADALLDWPEPLTREDARRYLGFEAWAGRAVAEAGFGSRSGRHGSSR